MGKLQKPPAFIGQSALQVGESLILDIYGIDTIPNDYIRPRDSSRFTFINVQLAGNYVNSTDGRFFPPGYHIFILNPTTKQAIKCIVVNSVTLSPTETSVILKSNNTDLASINTDWKVAVSSTLDMVQNIEECKFPKDIRSTFIERTSVRLQWISGFGAEENIIRIKDRNTPSWTIYTVGGSTEKLDLTTLSPNTTYDWQLTSKCDITKSILYSEVMTFETKP